MTSYRRLLAATTALTLVPAASAWAQQEDPEACTNLEQIVLELPEELPEGFEFTRDDLVATYEAGDVAQCTVVVETVAVQLQQTGQQEGEQQEAEQAEGERAVEQAETTITLQDQAVVRGTVFLERTQPQIQIQEGQSEITINPGQPDVTVNEGQAEVVIREQPATITVEMPQPTIRIEQPAPEIIITMPPPGVDVGMSQPQVEVRQAEPQVTVQQAAPQVSLELEVAEEGEEGGFEVQDRATGQVYAEGEVQEVQPVENAEVQMNRAEPLVTLQQSEGEPNVQVQRTEPSVRYEGADPQVQIAQGGEPVVEFTRSGEPMVTFQESAEVQQQEGQEQPEQAAEQPEAEQPEVEQPEVEQPEVEQPEAEQPEVEQPEAETEATLAPVEGTVAETEEVVVEPVDQAALGNVEANPVVTNQEVALEGYQPEGFQMLEATAMTAEQLTGAPLYSELDERIGEIGNAVLSQDGGIEQLIVEVGGFLGLGEHSVALGFDEVRIMQAEGGGEIRAYVNATREQLEAMPEYVQ